MRSLQRFVDMPTERQVKHRFPGSPRQHVEGPDPLEDPGLQLQ
ncbi:hypothetical protein SBD_4101 [Streptomyces bottropensis ATCC 25435]|uniref:Uncharacterized protein n=1 Tax=Streptomyces bottropensis ATCC 25435 TaxID=1054862 RepID=M3EYV4_9ACTN|nr:hypothetical protein SBD_4101 [Streptomyces bottropensis ATCC 25435]